LFCDCASSIARGRNQIDKQGPNVSNAGVAAVEKAPALLDCFTDERHACSVAALAALAKASGRPVTKTLRLLKSLERMS
jgi:hypothetical protein